MPDKDVTSHKGTSQGKHAGAYLTISELSRRIDVATHILRFWETRFPELKPMQRAGNRRYYRPADVELAETLNHLLNVEGYTVKGVQKLLSEQGVKQVVQRVRQPAPAPQARPGTAAVSSALPGQVRADLRQIRDRLRAALS